MLFFSQCIFVHLFWIINWTGICFVVLHYHFTFFILGIPSNFMEIPHTVIVSCKLANKSIVDCHRFIMHLLQIDIKNQFHLLFQSVKYEIQNHSCPTWRHTSAQGGCPHLNVLHLQRLTWDPQRWRCYGHSGYVHSENTYRSSI